MLQDAEKIKVPARGCKMDRPKGRGEQKCSDIGELRLKVLLQQKIFCLPVILIQLKMEGVLFAGN